MTTTPKPVTINDHPEPHLVQWSELEMRWIEKRDAQWQAYAQQARADLEAENADLKRDAEMHEAIRAGDSVLLNEQAALLRECRLALDELLLKKPLLAALVCGSTSLGNLKASMYDCRPAGVFGGEPALENTK